MGPLFRLFAGMILKVAAIFSFGSIAAILLLDRLFGGYEFYLGMLVLIAPLLAWYLGFLLVPKNLDWILALPISKRNVLVLHYATNLFASFSVLVSSVFAVLVLGLVKMDGKIQLENLARNAPNLVKEADLAPYMGGLDIYGWTTAFLMVSFFHALSMSISRPAATRRLYSNLWNHASPWVRWSVRAGWLPLLAAAAASRDYVLAPWGIFAIATLLFLVFTTFNTAHALGLARGQRRVWIGVSATLAAAQIAFLFAHAWRGTRSESSDRRVASVLYLGGFGGGIRKPDLARLLEGESSAERVVDLGEVFRKRFVPGEGRIPLGLSEGPDFARAIASKRRFRDALAAAALFEVSDLGPAQLDALFAKLQPLLAECRCEFPATDFLAARATVPDVVRWVESNNDVAVQFGLLWARYHRDAAFVPALHRGLPAYSDRLKLAALRTLSVLHGSRFGFSEWIEVREKARHGSKDRRVSSSAALPVFDCARPPAVVTELKAGDAGWLNACVRDRARPAQAAEVEAMGWFEPPLDARAAALTRKVLQLK